MSKKNSYIRITAACLAVCLLFSAAGCRGTVQPAETTTEPTQQPQKVLHTFRVTTDKDEPLENVGIYIYTDSTRAELITFAKTDADGCISFQEVPGPADPAKGYVAVLSNVPEGFVFDESYPVTATDTHIRLTGIQKPEVDVNNDVYGLGDIIPDFTVTAADGTEYTLSGLLEQKKAVVLNFWFIGCQPCRNEFPYLQAAYERFGSEVEVLALNPVDQDPVKINQFRQELGLTFPMLSCDPSWERMMQLTGYPTTVVIDRNGMIGLYHMGTITESGVFEDIFSHFTADDYESAVVKDIEDILSGNNADAPIEVGGVTSFEVTVKPGRLVYYNIYKVTNMYLQIRNADAYAIYNDRTYTPGNGVVGFNITTPDTYTPASVVFGNSGTKEITFTVTLSAYPGSNDNPYSMGLGSFDVSVTAGNDQGVYYKYYAEEEGVLTVTCLEAQNGVDYDFALYNTDTAAYRTLAGDRAEDGSPSVSINCYKGDYIKIVFSTLPDSSNVYPGGKFVFEAAFEEGEIKEEEKKEILDYAVTVTDESRNPVSGVYLYVETAEESRAIVTNEKGVAHVKLEKGTYRVTMAVPKEYSAKTNSFRLTPQRNVLSIKLDAAEIVMEEYIVRTVDEQGQPVPNVPVVIGSRFGYTGEDGTVTIMLEKDAYRAAAGVPEGFVGDAVWAPFLSDSNALTFTLKAGTSEEIPGEELLPYAVTVGDYAGNWVRDVAVVLMKDQEPVAVKIPDENGNAAFSAPEGEYTFTIAGLDAPVYWDETESLTADAPNASVTVARGITGEPEELYVGNAYSVNAGGTYVELQPGVTNYFTFTPEEPGLYRITTSRSDALVSYWGGSTVGLIVDQTNATDYDPQTNAFTRNIKQSNIGITCILGVTGEGGCVLQVLRVGDAILDETDIVPDVYQGEKTPTAPWKLENVSGKTLTYVDLTASSGEVCAVFNEADGFYHLNSADGPLLYVNLGSNAPYVSMYVMLGLTGVGGASLTQTFYDENGTAVRREDYTGCMQSYAANTDGKYGVYPLNDDLAYMLRQGGDRKGWWDPDNGNYLFADVQGLNQENAWMFAVCYFA